MCGRSGRAGIDDYGESILIIREEQKTIGFNLM